jgi:hypothetical protein
MDQRNKMETKVSAGQEELENDMCGREEEVNDK